MNILLLGGGGREHALAWKLAQSPACDLLWASPGNPGIAEVIDEVNARHGHIGEEDPIGQCFDMELTDHELVVGFCEGHGIDLVIVGPEAPLVDGLGDALRAEGIAVFGPSAAAARLEGSKGFTKDLCARAGIPTAGYVRTTSLDEARAALDRFAAPYVLKADGLAAGKGVVIAETRAEAEEALADMFGGQFGSAGAEVVIEEFMEGEEASFFVLTDGANIVPLTGAQDHKRVGEGDTGPNTGGMGAYSPAPVLTPALEAEVIERIIAPTVRTMEDMGCPYQGVLFAGLMLTKDGPRLIEYNCRFGDPETQVLMARLESDLVELLNAAANNALAACPPPRFARETALTVVMAAEGYPGTPKKGGAIDLSGVADDPAVKVFHAGTALDEDDGVLVANGGRVLNVTARGANVSEAQQRAYAVVDAVRAPDLFCRRDIGWREVAREATGA